MREPLKAWKASDGEWVEIVYADTRSRARLRGSGLLDAEYIDTTARRAPEFDHMAPKGPSQQQLFEQFGWSFECECGRMADQASGGRYAAGALLCDTCAAPAQPPGAEP